MNWIIRVCIESFRQAYGQLMGNKLRSFLSLLGITIGIFCIVAVKSVVDSLETDIRSSFQKLGDNVLYISRMPWTEDPGQNYWKYLRRPDPNIRDFQVLQSRMTLAENVAISYFIGMRPAKSGRNSLDNAFLMATSDLYSEQFDLQFEEGRFFSPFEYQTGADKIVIGYEVARSLFPDGDLIGRIIQCMGRKYQVIGVIEKSGESLINFFDFDGTMVISLTNARRIFNLEQKGTFGSSLTVKGREGVQLEDLKDESIQLLRAGRSLKPKQEDNFSINELTMLSQMLDGFFSVLNIAGFIIGAFAIFIGMFSVANIMFVSVRERTPIIGVKKALGAQQKVILLEFLIESIILCLIGGLLGLLVVFSAMKIITAVIGFELFLSVNNMAVGIALSVVIGILSGLLPALQAARMDPVEAMRQ